MDALKHRLFDTNPHEQVPVSRERIAKRDKDFSITGVEKTVQGPFLRFAISDEDYYCSDVVKRSPPLLFGGAASGWEVPLDLLGLIEEVAVECGLLRDSKLEARV